MSAEIIPDNVMFFVEEALDRLQFLEEIGGPEGDEYILTLTLIQEHLGSRMRNYINSKVEG